MPPSSPHPHSQHTAIGDLATGRARTVAFGYSKAASQVAKILTSMIGTSVFERMKKGWIEGAHDGGSALSLIVVNCMKKGEKGVALNFT